MMIMMIKEGKVLSNSTTKEGCKNQSLLLNNLTIHKRFNSFDALLISCQHRLAGSCNVEKLPSVFVGSSMLAFCVIINDV